MAAPAKIIRVEKIVYRDRHRLQLWFERDEELVRQVRRIGDCQWSETMGCWHIPYYANHLEFLNRKFAGQIRFLPLQEAMEKVAPTAVKVEPAKKSTGARCLCRADEDAEI